MVSIICDTIKVIHYAKRQEQAEADDSRVGAKHGRKRVSSFSVGFCVIVAVVLLQFYTC